MCNLSSMIIFVCANYIEAGNFIKEVITYHCIYEVNKASIQVKNFCYLVLEHCGTLF